MSDSVHIVNAQDWARLQTFRRRWWAGWTIAGVLTLYSVWTTAQVRAYREAKVTLTFALDAVDRVRSNQVESTQALVKAWEEKQEYADAVLEAAETIKAKQKSIDYNKQVMAAGFGTKPPKDDKR